MWYAENKKFLRKWEATAEFHDWRNFRSSLQKLKTKIEGFKEISKIVSKKEHIKLIKNQLGTLNQKLKEKLIDYEAMFKKKREAKQKCYIQFLENLIVAQKEKK